MDKYLAELFYQMHDLCHKIQGYLDAKEDLKPNLRLIVNDNPKILFFPKKENTLARESECEQEQGFVEFTEKEGPIIHVLGADLMDGTPIYDIKPYVTYADCHLGARSGFVDERRWQELKVVFPEQLQKFFAPDSLAALIRVLALDPRPQYQDKPEKVYGMPFEEYDIHFRVTDGVLTVLDIQNS